MFAQWIAQTQQMAYEFIAMDRVEIATPELGRLLLDLVKDFEEYDAVVQELRAHTEATAARLDAMDAERHAANDALWARMEEFEVFLEQQRQTIEALMEENDTLRAHLYVQDRKT